MFFWSHPRCFGPLGKFQHNIKISIKTARVSRLSVSCDYGEYQCLRKMSFWEIFEFQWIYLTKLEYRSSFKSLRTFIMIRVDMALCRCNHSHKKRKESLSVSCGYSVTIPASQIYTSPCHCPGHSIFHFSVKRNLHDQFHTVKKL